MPRARDLTAEDVRAMLDYDPETGILRWKTDPKNQRRAGDRAGSSVSNKDGYRSITIAGRLQKEHRVIWLHYYGKWPYDEIDHINGRRADNRICNLRIATRSQNCSNIPLYSNNQTGARGVRLMNGKFQVRVTNDGTHYHIGTFDTLAEGRAAYFAAAKVLKGEFFRDR